jgi:sterol desaturase/sphingolipid hydroxylase (fatty acid hydroxylase superfamily)
MLDQLAALHAYMFFGIASLLAILELVAPARAATTSVTQRWCSNIGLCLINLMLYRLLVPITAVAFSQYNLSQGGGLFQSLNVNGFLLVISGFLLLDLVKYIEHRLFHLLTPLWRLHLVHHSDTDVDFTTTERHHPLEHALGIFIVFGATSLRDCRCFCFSCQPQASI